MTPEIRVQISDRALSNYLRLCNERKIDLPDTDVFEIAVQNALMNILTNEEKKLCPLLQHSCRKTGCAWWSKQWEWCGMVSPQKIEDITPRHLGLSFLHSGGRP